MESVKTKTEEQEKVTIGIHRLEELIEKHPDSLIAMTYVCMKLSRENSVLGDRIMAIFEERLEAAKQNNYRGYDAECELLPMQQWLCFWEGFLLGSMEERTYEKD